MSNSFWTFLVSSKLKMRLPSASTVPNFYLSFVGGFIGLCYLGLLVSSSRARANAPLYSSAYWGSSLILKSVMPISVNRNRQRLRLLIPPSFSPLNVLHTSHKRERSSANLRFSNSTALSLLHCVGSLMKCRRCNISPNFR